MILTSLYPNQADKCLLYIGINYTVHVILISNCNFSDLLDSKSDGIEVSYNACGVLSHMMSDGPEAWTCDGVERTLVLSRMTKAINRWKLTSKRNINYRFVMSKVTYLKVTIVIALDFNQFGVFIYVVRMQAFIRTLSKASVG